MDIVLDTDFDPRHGEAVAVAPGIVRVTAPNAGPFTFRGTNSYLVGEKSVVVVDPGPDDAGHLAALLSAIAGRPVEAILLTHTHRDHSDLARTLKQRVGGAPILAEGPHRASRPMHAGESDFMESAGDMDLRPDRLVADGEMLSFGDATLRAVATPGHTANHMAYAVEKTGALLGGDHAMSWSTTIVAPPEGSMAAYMASLDRLIARDDALLLPGHGAAVRSPKALLRALKAHRRMRETAILDRLRSGDRSIPEVVAAIYRQTSPSLLGAAGLSVLAHLEDLVGRGEVLTEGPARLAGRFTPA